MKRNVYDCTNRIYVSALCSLAFRSRAFESGKQHARKNSQPLPTARIGIVTVAAASEEPSMWQRPSNIPPGSITMHGA